ncbi:hypothetical protein TNCV_2572451 [Trichonephila clavipes]|nr:hypothetical protein TNCV_2572451 [Trichonephila clavipes]
MLYTVKATPILVAKFGDKWGSNLSPRSLLLSVNEEFVMDVLEQGVKGHHTAPTNLIEFWTALANIWQVIPVACFQKLVESMPRRMETVIKATGVSTLY